MEAGGTNYILIIILGLIILYFIGIVYLSKKGRGYGGLILPVIFACVAFYNFLKPILIPNPYPTMQEGMYMTFFGALAIIGFVVFGISRYISKRNNDA